MSTQLMNTEDEYRLLCGLSGYLAAVSAAAGVGPESCTLDFDSPISAYIALDGHIAAHPGRDTALVWDEHHGWSFMIETHSGEDLLVVAYLGDELAPPPGRLREFLRNVRARTRRVALSLPPDFGGDRATLADRLHGYWTAQPLPGR
ncbi:MAG TPA: DUF6292 family protein [Amycolatopsis sp.]|nr:DUF6292 family protein [Amycolatopsis sp.]